MKSGFAPRPLGVRHKGEKVKFGPNPSPNKPTHAPRFESCGSSGFATLAFAHSAQPYCPRQRTRVYPGRGLALSARATS